MFVFSEKEKKDVDDLTSTKAMFDQASYETQMSKEKVCIKSLNCVNTKLPYHFCLLVRICSQEEYLDALNKQEIAKKELDGAQSTLKSVQDELARLRKDAESINTLYKEQDELLGE